MHPFQGGSVHTTQSPPGVRCGGHPFTVHPGFYRSAGETALLLNSREGHSQERVRVLAPLAVCREASGVAGFSPRSLARYGVLLKRHLPSPGILAPCAGRKRLGNVWVRSCRELRVFFLCILLPRFHATVVPATCSE